MAGHAAQDEQVRQGIDHRGRIELPVDPDRQALSGEFVDDVEHSELPPVVRPALDEVVGPDVVRPLRPETDARSVVQPEPALLGLSRGHLQPLPPPYSLDTLHIHGPARIPKKSRDPAVAVAPVLGCERDDVRRQRIIVGTAPRHLPLGRAMLSKYATDDALRNGELSPDMIDTGSATGGAQKFC